MIAVRIYEYGGPETLKFELDAPEPAMDADSVLIETVCHEREPNRLEGSLRC